MPANLPNKFREGFPLCLLLCKFQRDQAVEEAESILSSDFKFSLLGDGKSYKEETGHFFRLLEQRGPEGCRLWVASFVCQPLT